MGSSLWFFFPSAGVSLNIGYTLKNKFLQVKKTAANGIQTQNRLVRKQTPNQLAKLAKWVSVRLRIKWLWVRIPLLSLKLQILHLFCARSSLTFRQLQSVDSL